MDNLSDSQFGISLPSKKYIDNIHNILKITDIEFWEDEGQESTNHHYFYLCSYSVHKQYLLRSQFKLIR